VVIKITFPCLKILLEVLYSLGGYIKLDWITPQLLIPTLYERHVPSIKVKFFFLYECARLYSLHPALRLSN